MNTDPNDKGWLAIVNPNAGNGKAKKDWNRISKLFLQSGVKVEPRFTERKGHAIILTSDSIREGFRKIICVGGDGTLNEIVNGVFTQDTCHTTDVTLALIPVGTGNDWGRMFGIPTLYEGAVKVITENRQMLHDIGVVSYCSGKEQHKRYFINIAGLGFESVVVRKTNKQKDKGRSNKAIYFYNLLSSLVSYKIANTEITVNGETVFSKVFSLNVGNGRYCGGGMRQTPDAVPYDGLLDVTVIREMGRLEIIRNLKILYDGTILSHPKVDGYRTSHLNVKCDTLLYVEADGESLGHTPAEFRIIPASVNIVYAARITQ